MINNVNNAVSSWNNIEINIHVTSVISGVTIFNGIYSHLKNISCYKIFYLTSYMWRYVIIASLSS